MEPIPIFLGETAIDILSAFSKRVQNSYRGISGRLHPLSALEPVTVGDIRVTPIPVGHSAYDAFMFLIEAEGKRILHTGDFRLHGFYFICDKYQKSLLDVIAAKSGSKWYQFDKALVYGENLK